jgi:hypothetical protein
VSAVAVDTETQLAWEKRHRPRAGIAALISTIGLIVYYIGDQLLRQDVPTASGLESLVRAAQPGAVGELPSLRTEYFEFLDSKTSLLTMIGIGGVLGFVGMAWAVGFLGVVARGREAPMRKVILYVPIVGGVVVGISVLMAQIGTLTLTDDFLAGPRTVAAAVSAENDFLLWSTALFQLGSLTLAVGLVLISLNAMRVGILTRLMGYVGIVAGAMLVLFPLPVVQIFWMGALAALFFGRWPGGDPPAWRTGKAEPWAPRVAPPPRPQTAPAAPVRRKRKKRH